MIQIDANHYLSPPKTVHNNYPLAGVLHFDSSRNVTNQTVITTPHNVMGNSQVVKLSEIKNLNNHKITVAR